MKKNQMVHNWVKRIKDIKNFIIQKENMYIYPDYLKEGNPHTGDDLGLIKIINYEKLLNILEKHCIFFTNL